MNPPNDIFKLKWSYRGIINTRYGPTPLSTAEPNEKFWQMWRTDKDLLRDEGFSISKDDNGNWIVNYWHH